MDELKIYIEMKECDDSNGALPIADVIDHSTRAALNMSKYRIMWMLRKVEKEYIESGGFIVLDITEETGLRATAYNFNGKIRKEIQAVIPDVIFFNGK